MSSENARVQKHDQTYALTYVDTPIPARIYQQFARVCKKHISFGEVDARELLALLKEAQLLSGDARSVLECRALDIFQAQSIRLAVIHQYLSDEYARVVQSVAAMLRAYEAGSSILEIAHAARYSPYAIFRMIMREKLGAERARDYLRRISLSQVRVGDLLDARDTREYESVSEYDFQSPNIQRKMQEAAQSREDKFIALLRESGIKLRTQEDLIAEARESGEHPVTPDALFESYVTINGKRAFWIDFKAYCGTPVRFLHRKTRDQSRKYCAKFGPGFIAYEHGYVAGLGYDAISLRAIRDEIEKDMRVVVL